MQAQPTPNAADRSPLGAAALHLFTLAGFAVAQPIFDLLGRYPTFLIAHQVGTAAALAAFALALALVPPALLFAFEAPLGLLSARLRHATHLALVAVLMALFALPPLNRALAIGVCQTLALIPGVSRSGATIIGGLVMRLDRAAAAEFSFFLAMPTMAAAFAHDMWDLRGQFTGDRMTEIAIGFVFAFIAAAIVVRPFLRFVARSGFAPFAWYRIAAGVALLVALGVGWL